MRRFIRPGIVLALLASAAASPVRAQQPDRPPPAQEREGRVMQMFLDHATMELDLSVEQRETLGRILRETFQRRARLAEEGRQLQRRTRQALSDPATEGAAFERLGQATLALKQRELELLEWQRGRLLESLTPRQTLRFMLMQERLARRIETMRRDRERR